MKFVIVLLAVSISCASWAQEACRTTCNLTKETRVLHSFEFEFGNCDKFYHDVVSARSNYQNIAMYVFDVPGEIGVMGVSNMENNQGNSYEKMGGGILNIAAPTPTVELSVNSELLSFACTTETIQ